MLWRCWLATRPRGVDYVEQYERTLAELERIIAKADERYVDATKKFATAHADRLREMGNERIAMV
ncbi:MAG: hypothetical protein ABSF35_24550, partial [Polyangia bacterium]